MFGAHNRDDAGHSTAEYAVGTVGAACVGCILIETGQPDWFIHLIQHMFVIAKDGIGFTVDPTMPRLPF